jgi:NAD(P)H dehydrogenase (quinone)
MGRKIILTGATGKLGSVVLKNLLTLVPPADIIVSVYNLEGYQELTSKGVDVRAGDFNDPASLVSTFKGGDAFFLVSLPSLDDEYRIRTQAQAIDAAKKAGVKHIYYTSLGFPDGSGANVMRAHYATEDYLKKSGLKYTIIREGSYMESYPVFLGLYDTSADKVVVPGDGKIAFADRTELGEATANIIASGEHINETVLLTGGKAYSLKETTEILSSILQKEITFHKVSEVEFLEHNADKLDVAKWWVTTYPTIENGGLATVDPTLEKLLGRKPRLFEDMLKDTLSNPNAGNQELAEWSSH